MIRGLLHSFVSTALLIGAMAPGAFASDQGPCVSANAKAPRDKGKNRLVIGTGNAGGVFFPYGGGIARIVSAKLARTEMTAELTGGSVDNLKLLAKRQADLALSTVDSAYEAAQGSGVYQDVGKIPACAITVLYQSFVHIVASEASGIKTIAGMKGKRVSLGSPGSSTEVLAMRVLEVNGLHGKKDVTPQYLSVSEAAGAMKDGKLDAFFWIGGMPTSAVTDLITTPNVKVTFLDAGGSVPKLKDNYGPVYSALTLPKSVYNLPADLPGIGVGNLVAVNAEMPEQLVKDLLKTLFDNADEVRKIHPEAQTFSLEASTKGSSIPFHPGAIAFYKEKGVWP
jgi:TRAP transporter TAXI family solute receptor